jgi:rhomboid-like protein
MLDYTLFTSTFVHFGSMHLLFNMWACYNFLTPTGYSRAFEGSPYHTLSFFLSAGVLSGYAQHLTTMFSRSASTVWVRSGGASGALFGVFGVFCTQYPNAGVGIMFVPFSIAASTMLPLVMAFDAYGMVRGIPRLNLGHAVSVPL